MTELFVLCEHRSLRKHLYLVEGSLMTYEPCPGGHPATVEEVVERLKEQGHSVFIDCRFVDEAQDV